MSLPIRFEGMGVGDLVPWRMRSMSVHAVWLWAFLTPHGARVRGVGGDSHDEVQMEPTMHGRLAFAMTKAVSPTHGTPDGDDGDNEPMWSLELALSWARLGAACDSHALAESGPSITTTLAMLPRNVQLWLAQAA
jgi:hypothetical protein